MSRPSQQLDPLRRPVAGREPVSRRPLSARRRPRLPRRLVALLLGLLLLLAALIGLGEALKPTALATSTLDGPRLVTGPICLEEAVDVSSSMTAFTAQRERAERELLDFAPRELPSDRLSTAFFAGSARVALRPSDLRTLTSAPTIPLGIDQDGTRLAPAVRALQDARPAGPDTCAARALVVITDGQISDPAETAAALADGSYTRVYAIVPAGTGWGRPGPLQGELDSVAVHRFTDSGPGGRVASVMVDARPLDVVLGDVVGSLTGQQLRQSS